MGHGELFSAFCKFKANIHTNYIIHRVGFQSIHEMIQKQKSKVMKMGNRQNPEYLNTFIGTQVTPNHARIFILNNTRIERTDARF
jgi:hypothetical protein